jgi:phospholipid-binding lipoprotein MlaA
MQQTNQSTAKKGEKSVKKLAFVCGLLFLLGVILSTPSVYADGPDSPILLAQTSTDASADEEDEDEYEDDDEYDEYEEDVELIPDPIMEFNYGMWVFNDRLYFWVLKPVAQVYGFVIPEEIRISVKNMFYNIRFPVRFINCLLQGKGQKAKDEFFSFFVNTTAGFLGMANVASYYEDLPPSPEDFGQTFAVWGFDSGAYLMLPFLGPSSFRDGLGKIPDTLADPIFWLTWNEEWWVGIAVRAYEAVNDTWLSIGDYEALLEASLDPYTAIRNAWVQNRNKLIAE